MLEISEYGLFRYDRITAGDKGDKAVFLTEQNEQAWTHSGSPWGVCGWWGGSQTNMLDYLIPYRPIDKTDRRDVAELEDAVQSKHE